MQRVLRLRCERTTLCDPDETDAQVRAVAANLAALPVAFPNPRRRPHPRNLTTVLLMEGNLRHREPMRRSRASVTSESPLPRDEIAGFKHRQPGWQVVPC
jgi:hypothetical protein